MADNQQNTCTTEPFALTAFAASIYHAEQADHTLISRWL